MNALNTLWSRGNNRPLDALPALATDCHHHIYDARYPAVPGARLLPPDASIHDYQRLQQRLGLTRHVLVQPSTYGTDNRCLVDALLQFGSNARGVASINASIDKAALIELQAAGVRGIRVNPLLGDGTNKPAQLRAIASHCEAMNWHLQVNASADFIAEMAPFWRSLTCPVVFDHLGHLPHPDAKVHPAFGVICELLGSGNGWVKLTGLYNDGHVGPPTYRDSADIALAYLRHATYRVIWGTDWPHPTEAADNKPNDADLLDLLAAWCRSDGVPDNALEQVMVHNPQTLYKF